VKAPSLLAGALAAFSFFQDRPPNGGASIKYTSVLHLRSTRGNNSHHEHKLARRVHVQVQDKAARVTVERPPPAAEQPLQQHIGNIAYCSNKRYPPRSAKTAPCAHVGQLPQLHHGSIGKWPALAAGTQ